MRKTETILSRMVALLIVMETLMLLIPTGAILKRSLCLYRAREPVLLPVC